MQPTNPCRTAWQQKYLGLDCVHPSIQRMADEAQAFCFRFYANNPSPALLVLCGESGVGKTHTLKRIHHVANLMAFKSYSTGVWKTGRIPEPRFFNWPEVVAEFNAKNFSAMDDLFACDLLCLDDIGAENDPWHIAKDKLCQILSRRENRFTAITTNIAPEHWCEKFDQRINDRLCRNASHVLLENIGTYALKK